MFTIIVDMCKCSRACMYTISILSYVHKHKNVYNIIGLCKSSKACMCIDILYLSDVHKLKNVHNMLCQHIKMSKRMTLIVIISMMFKMFTMSCKHLNTAMR